MRALFIALVLVALGAGGYFFYQQQQAPSPAEPTATQTLPQTDGSVALALFNDICVEGRENFAQNEARATAAGWVAAADDVSPQTGAIAAVARGADVGATGTVLTVYDHPDHEQYLMLTDLTISGQRLNGCYIYDFQAGGLPDFTALQETIGAPPQVDTHPGVVDSRQWTRPPAFPNVATIRVG